MITVTFFENKENFLVGFSVKGHAQMDDYGRDIVCAAVSSVVYMVVNTLTDVIKLILEQLTVNDGFVLVRVKPEDVCECSDLFLGFKLHVLGLKKQYPGFIKANFKKIF